MTVDGIIKEIGNDSSSGASELMIRAVDCLKSFSEESKSTDTEPYYNEMVDMGKRLIAAQPSMAPLFNAVNTVLLEVEKGMDKGDELHELRRGAILAVDGVASDSRDALQRIQVQVTDLIKDASTILIHSYSSTVIGSLISAKERGYEFEVIVTESRPILEGRKTSKLLAEKGIKTTLIADMAAFHFLEDCDIVLLGCDCVCQDGIINKIGTKGLAIASSELGVNAYVLGEKIKFLPSHYREYLEIEQRPKGQIWEEAGGIDIYNIYFDLTPLRYFSGIVTEDGLFDKEEVLEILHGLVVSRGLL